MLRSDVENQLWLRDEKTRLRAIHRLGHLENPAIGNGLEFLTALGVFVSNNKAPFFGVPTFLKLWKVDFLCFLAIRPQFLGVRTQQPHEP
jgi:hypothetical protein